MPAPFWPYQETKNRRLEANLYARASQPIFFTIRAVKGRTPFSQPRLAEMVSRCLLEQETKSRCTLVVHRLMPDHLHLVAVPDDDGISTLKYVDRMKGWTSRLAHLSGWTGPLWQPRSYDHAIRHDEDLRRIVAYIMANPMRRGLCEDPEDYPWMSVNEDAVRWLLNGGP